MVLVSLAYSNTITIGSHKTINSDSSPKILLNHSFIDDFNDSNSRDLAESFRKNLQVSNWEQRLQLLFGFPPKSHLNGILKIISNINLAGGIFSWNGQSVNAGENIVLTTGQEITNDTLKYSPSIADGMYRFMGFSDENALPITSISELKGVRVIKANFQPIYFSHKYGEKWIRIAAASNENMVWSLPNNISNNNIVPIISKLDFSSESSLWCFVGNADNFKIYNKLLGEDYALSLKIDDDIITPIFTQVDSAFLYTINNNYIRAIIPSNLTSVNNVDDLLVFNISDGVVPGNNISYDWASEENSQWIIKDASFIATVTNNLEGLPTKLPSTQRDCYRLVLTIDALTTKLEFPANSTSYTLYLPRWMQATIAMPEMERSYALRSFKINDDLVNDVKKLAPNIANLQINITARYKDSTAHKLFASPDSINLRPFRIPAFSQAFNGDLIAINDYRPGYYDIGYNGIARPIDLVSKISKDNGRTWSKTIIVAQHSETDLHKVAYGDAALCTDRQSNQAIILAAAGYIGFFNSSLEKPLRIVRINGSLDSNTQQWTWAEPVDISDYIYKEVLKGQEQSLFVASGKLQQSRVIKNGSHYRIYAILLCRSFYGDTWRNRVLFSDDFGNTWQHLGNIYTDTHYLTAADEGKCEELSDGTLIITSRNYNQRQINIFTYGSDVDDIAEGRGEWGIKNTYLNGHGTNASNGETYFIHASNKQNQKQVLLALQTLPAGEGRNNVSLFYREIDEADLRWGYLGDTYDWQKTEFSPYSGAYSTFDLQQDGKFGFFIEENYDDFGGYDMNYFARSLEELTDNQYTLNLALTLDSSGQAELTMAYPIILPKDLKVYIRNNPADTSILSPINTRTIPANTPIILKGKSNTTYYYQETRNTPSFANSLSITEIRKQNKIRQKTE